MQKYECKNCGGELLWDPNAGALKCQYCDSEYQPSDFEDRTLNEQSVKSEEIDGKYTNFDESMTEGMAVYSCSECGADLIASKTAMTTICAYCGRPISITDKSVGNFRPQEVIPFGLDHEKAVEKFKKYAKSSFLTPKTFSENHVIEKMQGLFVPFFLHSMNVDGRATIVGENYSSRRRGDDKITTTKVYKVVVESKGLFKDVPTDASKQMDNALMDALEPFSYDKREAFNPAYMAGYFAEQPDETVEEVSPRAEAKIKKAIDGEMLDKAGLFDSKKIETSNHNFDDKKSTYAMLPVWLLNVDYHGKKYLFAVNGETGKVVGKLPMSKGKLALISGGAFAIINIVATFLLMGGII